MPGITKSDIQKVMKAMGAKGGRNSRKNLTAEEKKALAQRAAQARWAKKKDHPA